MSAERVLGEIAALRQHDRQRLADVAHLVLGERHLRALVEDRARRSAAAAPAAAPAPSTRRDPPPCRRRPRPRAPAPRKRRSSGCVACATLLRRNAACSMPGSSTSSTNSAWPRSSRASSLRLIGAPKFRVVMVSAPQPFGGQRTAADDVLVAGAAAKIAGERLADLRLVRLPASRRERPSWSSGCRACNSRTAGRDSRASLPAADADGRRSAASPSTVAICVTVGLRREHQAGAHRGAVEDHRAGAAHAVLAADVSAREQQVVAQEIAQQQCATRPHGGRTCRSPSR